MTEPLELRNHSAVESLQENTAAGLTVPLIEEQLAVGKRVLEKGTLHLEKRVLQHSETVEVPLTSVTWEVEHVAVNRVVRDAPPVRQEGNITIYSLVEERVVVTRQLVLCEEVRVTRRESTRVEPVTYTLQKEVLETTRTGADG